MRAEVIKIAAARLPRPLPPRGMKGGGRPGHVWVHGTPLAIRCEGIDPFGERPKYAPGHDDIGPGGSFLRKYWETFENDVFGSRHCLACGGWIEEESGEW